jgi:hypothetical protein
MYDIGQLLWLIVDATKSIEPVQVVSKTTLESIDGVDTRHNVQVADGDQFCIEEYDAVVFQTAKAAEAHLLEMATSLVKKLVVVAEEKAKAFNVPEKSAKNPFTGKPKQSKPAPKPTERDGLPLVELPDGTMARVHIPESLQ